MAIAALCMAAAPAVAQTESPSGDPRDAQFENMQRTITDLQKQVDALKSANDTQWLTQQRADEIRGLVHDVLADADTRASLLETGMTAGWDNGFFIGSTDGNYLLKISGMLQVRFVYNHQNESPTDNDQYGFEIRRAKVDLQGHVFDPSWQYQVEFSAASNGGDFTLGENGWIQKTLGDVKLRFGQFKPLFSREENVSSRRLLAVERSLVNSEFTVGTAQGLQALYQQDKWRVAGSVIDGANTGNTSWSAEDSEYAFTGRLEFLPMGDWKSVEDNVGFRGTEQALLLGAAILFQEDEAGTPADEQQNITVTADVTYKNSGWDLMGEFFYRNLSSDSSDDLDQYGAVFTGGYFVTDDIELYVMYQWGSSDIDGDSDLSVLTVGFTKFFNKHQLKWQNDIGYGFNAVASTWANDGAGWRTDAPDEDGQVVIRSQFQLLF